MDFQLDITPECISALWEPAREAFNNYHAAMDAYEADLKSRQNALDQQAQQLDKDVRRLGAQIKSLEAKSRDAASRGDLNAAAEADEQADELRQQAATARRKRRIANAAELRGDSALYERCKAAQVAYETAFAACQAEVRAAVAEVHDWRERLECLEKEVRNIPDRGPGDAGYTDKRWKRIDRNFRRDYYAQIEAQAEREKQNAQEREDFERRVFVYG